MSFRIQQKSSAHTKNYIINYSIYYIILCVFALALVLTIPTVVEAQGVHTIQPLPSTVSDTGTLPGFAQNIVNISVGAAGVLAVLMLVVGGVQYVGSGVSPQQKENAKETIRSAVLGLIIVLGAYAILFTINPDLVSLRFSVRSVNEVANWNTGNTVQVTSCSSCRGTLCTEEKCTALGSDCVYTKGIRGGTCRDSTVPINQCVSCRGTLCTEEKCTALGSDCVYTKGIRGGTCNKASDLSESEPTPARDPAQRCDECGSVAICKKAKCESLGTKCVWSGTGRGGTCREE